MDAPIIRLRPHHALCLRHFAGKGYSEEFVKNMTQLHRRLNSGARQMVQIIMHRDSICGPCPHEHNGVCDTEEKVRALDRGVAEACGLRSGQWLPWSELCELIDQYVMPDGIMPQVCRVCEWYELCEGQHR